MDAETEKNVERVTERQTESLIINRMRNRKEEKQKMDAETEKMQKE